MIMKKIKKTALITGISGQDGSYLAEFLLKKGYIIHGLVRRASTFNIERIKHLLNYPHKGEKLFLHYGDLSDSGSINSVIAKTEPDEIYHLGAQSHVLVSFDIPEYTGDVTGLGTLRILDAIRETGIKTKFYQASSSEMFGKALEIPIKETTPFYPRSPYGVAKVYAYWITKNYRESYDMFACNGILFNHESPRRGRTFVTRKITRAIAMILQGKLETLYLGNIDASRDWGHAKDYVNAMWLMMQHKTPDDYVIASGETHTVREFVEKAFKHVNIDIVWKGKRVDEIGIDKKTKKTLVKIDPIYFRPAEVELLLGDSSKAKKELKWEMKYSFDDMINEMMEFDLTNEAKKNGYVDY